MLLFDIFSIKQVQGACKKIFHPSKNVLNLNPWQLACMLVLPPTSQSKRKTPSSKQARQSQQERSPHMVSWKPKNLN